LLHLHLFLRILLHLPCNSPTQSSGTSPPPLLKKVLVLLTLSGQRSPGLTGTLRSPADCIYSYSILQYLLSTMWYRITSFRNNPGTPLVHFNLEKSAGVLLSTSWGQF
jgi:hypothetical protein